MIGASKLEVLVFTKEFEEWSTSKIINEPQSLTFRWSTKASGVESAIWTVFGPKPGRGNQPGPPLASGILVLDTADPSSIRRQSVKADKKLPQFEINFAPFIPKWPPVSPGSYPYFVVITPTAADLQPVGLSSPAVKITYKAPPPPPQINACDKKADCPADLVCNPASKTCVNQVFWCEDNHVVVGSDGTARDCVPYECIANTCKTKCASVDDCFAPYVCNQTGQCVHLPS